MTTDIVMFTEDVTVAEARAVLAAPDGDHAAWRQALYPIVDVFGAMDGVVTRGDVLGSHDLTGLGSLIRDEPTVTHPDQTLRAVAEHMAIHDVTVLPVMAPVGADRIVGIVSLPQLLFARRRDHQEARHRERFLRIRVISG